MNKNVIKKATAVALAGLIAVSSFPGVAIARGYSRPSREVKPIRTEMSYNINNPYEGIDWANTPQYKADFHAHSRNSDGGNYTYEMVEDHYAKGFDILAMTDHNYVTRGWENANDGAMSIERKEEIQTGVGRDGRGMLDFSYSNEQSRTDHINTFLTDWNNEYGATMENTISTIHNMGGISHINHMGRYNRLPDGRTPYNLSIEEAREYYSRPEIIGKYTYLLENYSSVVGMEIINKIDNESRYDRILWDNVLMEMMPQGREVFGFSNDDTHSLNATGYSFNMMLQDELTIDATRESMENGTFYAVSRVSRVDGINDTLPNGSSMPGSGRDTTTYLLEQSTPSITDITVNAMNNEITIRGENYSEITWIADGEVVATGETVDLNDIEEEVNSYIRAELKSDTGIAFTQPFGVEEKGLTPVSEKVAGEGYITIQLTNATKEYEGSIFRITETKTGVTTEVEVDENGYARVAVPFGAYRVQQVKASEGYRISTNVIDVPVLERMSVQNLKFVNR